MSITVEATRSIDELVAMFEEATASRILSVDAVQVAAPGIYSTVYALDPSLVTADSLSMLRSEGLSLLVRSYDFNYDAIEIYSDGYSRQGRCVCYSSCDCVVLYEATHNDTLPEPIEVTVALYEID